MRRQRVQSGQVTRCCTVENISSKPYVKFNTRLIVGAVHCVKNQHYTHTAITPSAHTPIEETHTNTHNKTHTHTHPHHKADDQHYFSCRARRGKTFKCFFVDDCLIYEHYLAA